MLGWVALSISEVTQQARDKTYLWLAQRWLRILTGASISTVGHCPELHVGLARRAQRFLSARAEHALTLHYSGLLGT